MDRRNFFERLGVGAISTSIGLGESGKTGTLFGNSQMLVKFENGFITSWKKKDDSFNTDYILENHRFGDLKIVYKIKDEPWKGFDTYDNKIGSPSVKGDLKSGQLDVTLRNDDLEVIISYISLENGIIWKFKIKNRTNQPIILGDVGVPFPMNSSWSWNKDITYNQRVIRHSIIAGHNSYLFWTRCNAVGPFLLLTPIEDTSLEFFNEILLAEKRKRVYTAYIHSLAQGEKIKESDTSWRQEHTGKTLSPNGNKEDTLEAGFLFQWANDYTDIQQKIWESGLFDIKVAPGMTVPVDTKILLGLKGKNRIKNIESEFPKGTRIKKISGTNEKYQLYEIYFNKLGENLLKVNYGQKQHFVLEFFTTESLDTLLKKRGNFHAERLQIIDNKKWYNGLLSDWDMKDKVLLSPENLHTIPEGRRYMVTCDDPGLGRPAFLAAKNVEWPVQKEVTALEYYINHFVLGGLQMTEEESYPYAIYGIPDWKRNRDSEDLSDKGQAHLWRIYDYPHIILMYLSMYRIARYQATVTTQKDWEFYLDKAYQTTVAFYTYPMEIVNWSPFETGNYNEVYIVELIEELEAEGWSLQATRLKHQWEKKVKYFLSGKANMFGSEYPYDTTGFESTHAIARYAVFNAPEKIEKESKFKFTHGEATAFMKKQIDLNIGCRGWLEKAYYQYGSDYRGSGNSSYTLSYMSQMGGWSILDYALNFSRSDFELLNLGYGSILSSWALLNSGTKESNYGYWFPGKLNDGGAGGGFEPLASARTWLGQHQGRGSWSYGCEIDLGFCGFLRSAATILADDPILGHVAYGGKLKQDGETFLIYPEDGVMRRFHIIWQDFNFHLEIKYDRFRQDHPIVIDSSFNSIKIEIENTQHKNHEMQIIISSSGEVPEKLSFNGKALSTFKENSVGEKFYTTQFNTQNSVLFISK